MIPDVAKVCALLSVRQTGVPLLSRLLQMPRERVVHIVDMLHLNGHLENAQDDEIKAISDSESMIDVGRSIENSLGSPIIGRLWSRLIR